MSHVVRVDAASEAARARIRKLLETSTQQEVLAICQADPDPALSAAFSEWMMERLPPDVVRRLIEDAIAKDRAT